MPVCAVVFGVRSGCSNGTWSLARRLARGQTPGPMPSRTRLRIRSGSGAPPRARLDNFQQILLAHLRNAETVHTRHRPQLRRDLRVAGHVSAAQEDAARSAGRAAGNQGSVRGPGAWSAAGAGGRCGRRCKREGRSRAARGGVGRARTCLSRMPSSRPSSTRAAVCSRAGGSRIIVMAKARRSSSSRRTFRIRRVPLRSTLTTRRRRRRCGMRSSSRTPSR